MIWWADMVMLTIARAIQDILTKKQKLWIKIAQSPKVLDALSEIETQLIEIGSDDLVRLFGRWIDLLLTHNNLEKLKKLKNKGLSPD